MFNFSKQLVQTAQSSPAKARCYHENKQYYFKIYYTEYENTFPGTAYFTPGNPSYMSYGEMRMQLSNTSDGNIWVERNQPVEGGIGCSLLDSGDWLTKNIKAGAHFGSSDDVVSYYGYAEGEPTGSLCHQEVTEFKIYDKDDNLLTTLPYEDVMDHGGYSQNGITIELSEEIPVKTFNINTEQPDVRYCHDTHGASFSETPLGILITRDDATYYRFSPSKLSYDLPAGYWTVCMPDEGYDTGGGYLEPTIMIIEDEFDQRTLCQNYSGGCTVNRGKYLTITNPCAEMLFLPGHNYQLHLEYCTPYGIGPY